MNPVGILDIHEDDRKLLDYVLAGYHYGAIDRNVLASLMRNITNFLVPQGAASYAMVERNTRDVIAALEKNDVFALTHPGDKMPVDLASVAAVCAKTDTLLELNTSHRSLTASDIGDMVKVADVSFIISSDAHRVERIGDFASAVDLLIESGIDMERVVNLRWR
jgi:putative hydrolase